MKIDTREFPKIQRNPFAYEATLVSVEAKTGKESGEPYLNYTWDAPIGKRFSITALKSRWFEPGFKPSQLTHDEFGLFARSVGAQNRQGQVSIMLGDATPTCESAAELREALEAVAVGKKFWLVEKQKVNKDGTIGEGYNIDVYASFPKRLPKGCKVIQREPEAEKADSAE